MAKAHDDIAHGCVRREQTADSIRIELKRKSPFGTSASLVPQAHERLECDPLKNVRLRRRTGSHQDEAFDGLG
jgi:hypothetical protein